ncbi:hypothetical protein [Gluconacetobacter diazotrophicus]|uniref:Uncharacterized protein n=2 Tax=Gluconacetobacter diazotrophicus TaxID=33996 RepID=A0A7W4FCQ5_GLUDI|nr:hypothetical protein [Gluconacetobacter diazotrophicus]MBB2155365.1 hypothetical protein [Gluconacetobacter diazotrophicus]
MKLLILKAYRRSPEPGTPTRQPASLKINDQENDDTFHRTNITEMVITPEGEFYAYNVKFVSQFERAENQPNGS